MPRSIAALAALAALVMAVPSAAQVGSGQIAYAREGEGIYTLAPEGGAPVLLKSGVLRQARWSPDGSRIAYVAYSNGYELHVMNADGTGDHIVATEPSGDGVLWLSKQPWSPDGSRLAWGHFNAGDIYTASAAGGDVRRITTDGRLKDAPVWSPSGTQLAYASTLPSPGSYELFSARDDGSAPVQITSGGFQNRQPSWSPNGSSIAFVRTVASRRSIYVVRPDGTDLHRVVDFSGSDASGEPAWSPDGSKIVYTNNVNGRYVRATAPGVEIFVANADGSGERRLTELAPQFAYDSAPTWSPDGDQILFNRRYQLTAGLTTMNPDGTCESALSADPRATPSSLESPSWQTIPGGAAIGPKTCRAVALEPMTPPRGGRAAVVGGTISNEGTEALSNVVVTIAPTRTDLGLQPAEGYACTRRSASFVCRIERLDRGQSQFVGVLGTARRVGRDRRSSNVSLSARLTVTADGTLLPTRRDTGYVFFTPSRCVTTDRGGGYIEGTDFPDRICGRRGADEIDPLGGKDYVFAGAGPDVINSWDNRGDEISCGPGRDRVFADRKDKVSRDCERVRRD